MRILYVHPRLTGSLQEWSGLSEPHGQSSLIEHTKEMGFNALWFSPFFATSDLDVTRNGKTVSGSLYASKDHFHFDREFSAAPDEPNELVRGKIDDAHIRHFTRQAADNGITVMGDLVFNHVARDHPLALKENAAVEHLKKTAANITPLYRKDAENNDSLVGVTYDTATETGKTMYFKFKREADLSLTMPGCWVKKIDERTQKEVEHFDAWDDVAPINYASPEAYDFFVAGKPGQKGYWKQAMDWFIDRGFTGFRCDACYMVPAKVWSDLSQYAHNRLPDVIFMGETLGDNGKADQLKEAHIMVDGHEQQAFDLAMLPTYWWNFKDDWMIKEADRLQEIARLGGAAFPDNHDTLDTIAGYAEGFFANMPKDQREKAIADVCLRNYAVATLVANTVYMQMGYEYCRKQLSVFRDPAAHQYWKDLKAERGQPDHALNITERIRAINDFKEALHDANACVKMESVAYCGSAERLLKIECRLTNCETHADMGRLVVFINEKPENGPIQIRQKDLDGAAAPGGLDRLILGPADAAPETMRTINDVAAFYTPLPATDNVLPFNKAAAPPPTLPLPLPQNRPDLAA